MRKAIGRFEVDGSLLERVTVLRALSDAERQKLAQFCFGFRYPKGFRVLSAQDPPDGVYFVLTGEVSAVLVSDDGRELAYEDLGPGSMFGELAAIDGGRRLTDISTTTETSAIKLSPEGFQTLLRSQPRIAEQTIYRLTELVRALAGRLFEATTKDARSRVRGELLRRAQNAAHESEAEVYLPQATHQKIANHAGTQREVATKEINELIRLGVLGRCGRRLFVRDLQRLTSLAGDER